MPTPTKTPTATFLRQDATTQGNWVGTYGAQGVVIPLGPDWLPSDATISPLDESGWGVWYRSTTDPRALVTTWDTSIGLTRRLAAGWVSSGSFEVDVNLRDGQVHGLELYLLDWDNAGRAEQVKISDARTGAILSTQSVSSFQSGLYLDYAVSGHVRITITNQGGPGVILNGLFLDPTRPAHAAAGATPGFEQVAVGAGQFQYRPTGSPWTFTGGAGISGNNSGFTAGNPPAPRGRAGRLPPDDRLVQPDRRRLGRRLLRAHLRRRPAGQLPGVAAGLPGPGRRHRGRHLHALRHVVPVLHHRPRSRSPPGRTRSRSRAWTPPAATTPPSSTRSPQASMPVDRRRRASSRWRWAPASSSTAPPARPGPSPAAPASRATAAASPPATRRRPRARRSPSSRRTGSFSQTIAGWAAGSYMLTFSAAQRGNPGVAAGLPGPGRRRRGGHLHALGHVVPELHHRPRSPSPPGRTRSRSRAWTAPAATTPPSSTRSPGPACPSIGDPGFEQVAVGAGHFQYRPTGSPWTFSGGAGISGNNSGFTAGNPPAPQGAQVAFLQKTGSFSQAVTGWAAGSYVLDLLRRPAGQLPGVAAGLPGPGRRHRGRHLHALRHVVPVLPDRRVHGHRRVAHDHLPGPGHRRRRQHRLRR